MLNELFESYFPYVSNRSTNETNDIFVVERGRLGDHADRSSLLGYWTANQTASFCVFYFMTDSRDYGLADTSRARLSSRLL